MLIKLLKTSTKDFDTHHQNDKEYIESLNDIGNESNRLIALQRPRNKDLSLKRNSPSDL